MFLFCLTRGWRDQSSGEGGLYLHLFGNLLLPNFAVQLNNSEECRHVYLYSHKTIHQLFPISNCWLYSPLPSYISLPDSTMHDTTLINNKRKRGLWLTDPCPQLLLTPSFPVSVPLFLFGRLAETPDAGAIWPQQSQERRCITAPKERETLELTWLLSPPIIVFINGGRWHYHTPQ